MDIYKMENHPQRYRGDGPSIIYSGYGSAVSVSILSEFVNELVSAHEDIAANLKRLAAEFPALNIAVTFEDAINPINGQTYCRIKRAEKVI